LVMSMFLSFLHVSQPGLPYGLTAEVQTADRCWRLAGMQPDPYKPGLTQSPSSLRTLEVNRHLHTAAVPSAAAPGRCLTRRVRPQRVRANMHRGILSGRPRALSHASGKHCLYLCPFQLLQVKAYAFLPSDHPAVPSGMQQPTNSRSHAP